MLIIVALFVFVSTIRSSVMAQEEREMYSRDVEKNILAITIAETYDDAFVKQGLAINHDYNALTYNEKMFVSKDAMERYDAVLRRVAFVMQQRINNIITSPQPLSDLFQPTMELNSQIVQLQWNYQQMIINLEQFEQLRVGIRDSYLSKEFIPNYYIREQVTVTEEEFLSYQQTVGQGSIVPYPSSSEVVSEPTSSANPPALVTSSNPSSWNKPVKPISPVIPEVGTSSRLSSDDSYSSTSSELVSSESVSSELTSSSVSDTTSSENAPLIDKVPEPIVSTPDSGLTHSVGTLDAYGDINLVAVYIMAVVGALAAIVMSGIIIVKSR